MAKPINTEPQTKAHMSRLEQIRRETARFVHDASTPVLTLRALAASLSDGDAETGLQERMEAELDRLSLRIDRLWHAISTQTMIPAPPIASEPDLWRGMETGPHSPPDAPGRALRILLVDDDAIHRDIGCRLLGKLGHNVTPCADICSVGDLCGEDRFDVLFLDQYCPGMLGSDLVRQRVDTALSGTPPWIVGMSADPRQAEMRALCLEAGMQDFLEKPITRAKLETALDRALKYLPPVA